MPDKELKKDIKVQQPVLKKFVVYSQISQDLRVWSGSAVEIVEGVSVSATEIMGFKFENGEGQEQNLDGG